MQIRWKKKVAFVLVPPKSTQQTSSDFSIGQIVVSVPQKPTLQNLLKFTFQAV